MNDVREVLSAAGFLPGELLPDGVVRRCHVKGDKPGTRNGWYVCRSSPSGTIAVYGSWRTGEQREWRSSSHVPTLMESTWNPAADVPPPLDALWASCSEARPTHPYLVRKKVKPFGIRQNGPALMIPFRDGRGRLKGLQRIFPDGQKRMVKGRRFSGCFHSLNSEGKIIIVGEGYATCASLLQRTEDALLSARVVMRGSASNLLSVCTVMRESFPWTRLVVAADPDPVGVSFANRAAEMCGAEVLLPGEL